MNKFLDNSPSSLCDVSFTDDATGLIVQREDEANFLNNYFVNISTRLGLNSDTIYVNDLPRHNVTDLLCLENIEVDIDENVCLSRNIDISKSSCIKQVNSKICRDLMLILPDKLCKLFNVSLSMGIFP